jgi:RNA polymerase sigma-70 factor (ECF subfamily)
MDKLKKEFSKIYDKYVEKIFRFVFLKVNSKEVAEDLTSETFLRTWEVFRQGNQKIENVSAFLYQTARNLITDYYREKGKAQIISPEAYPIADPRQSLEKQIILNSEMERVRKALSQLNEDYQNAIIWYYLDEMPIQEVANLLDRTVPATRVLISRAIKALREQLSNEQRTIKQRTIKQRATSNEG